jgi:hypothetical protein
MEEIFQPNDDFDFDKLILTKPTSIPGGNFFMRFLINGSHVYVQPPQCKTKQGIIKVGKRIYTDLMFTNENDQFIRWMENLESYCHKYILKNKSQWFEGELELHDIENYFTSPIKVYKSGSYYTIRTNITTVLGKPTLKIYDEHENELDIESINDKMNIMSIIEIQGIKCSARSFQIEIELKQLLVLRPVNIFDKCLLSNANSLHKEKKMELVDENKDRKESKELEEESKELEEESKELEEESKELEEESKELEEESNKNELEEIDFNLDNLPDEETMQIRKRNEVYYEMYREARRKAKIARDLALSSYLEAKHIKNTYMLDDIKDSDESDLELDNEEAFLANK